MQNKADRDLRGYDKAKIERLICEGLRKSFKRDIGKGVPMWSNILYLLDRYNEGNFIGNLSLRIAGGVAYGVRIKEQEIMMGEYFADIGI